MKAISLDQPLATAAAIGLKQWETRSWRTNHLGPIAIQATLRRTCAQRTRFEELLQNPIIHAAFEAAMELDFDSLQFGAIIAVAEIDVVADSCFAAPSEAEQMLGDFSPGRFIFRLKNVRRLSRSIPCSGHQRIWNVPTELLPQLAA